MNIERTYVKNFKSIDQVEVYFTGLNVFIGKNAAGKSNFLELFEFLTDIGKTGLEDAIQLRGGVEYFRNTRLSESTNFEISCTFKNTNKKRIVRPTPDSLNTPDGTYNRSEIYSTDYRLELSFEDGEYNVVDEHIQNSRVLIGPGLDKKSVKELRSSWPNINEFVEKYEEAYIYHEDLTRNGDNINYNIVSDQAPENIIDDLEDKAHIFETFETTKKESMITYSRHPLRDYAPGMRGLSELGSYNINVNEIKKGTTLKGKRELEKNGNNLPLVLKEIVRSEEDKNKFLNLIDDLLPFISDWETDTLRDKSILLEILEEFEEEDEEYLPASLVSDGTVNVISIIIIMYFEDINIAMIEEPERHIHPSLISKIVEMMEDVGNNSKKQIFTTTHNVELIKNISLDNIFLVTRDDSGFTQIDKPNNSERIREFLENGLGLSELYVQNILESEI
jgi:predicted ATPase